MIGKMTLFKEGPPWVEQYLYSTYRNQRLARISLTYQPPPPCLSYSHIAWRSVTVTSVHQPLLVLLCSASLGYRHVFLEFFSVSNGFIDLGGGEEAWLVLSPVRILPGPVTGKLSPSTPQSWRIYQGR